MSKQINFYMSEKIQECFIEYLQKNRFVFLDNNAIAMEHIEKEKVYSVYLYKQSYGNVIMRQDNSEIIDSIKSFVIQFKKTIIKEEQKKVLRGRLWLANQYNDEDGNLVKKDGTIIKDYEMLVRWIKKNVPYQEIKKGDYFVNDYVSDELKVLQSMGFTLTL